MPRRVHPDLPQPQDAPLSERLLTRRTAVAVGGAACASLAWTLSPARAWGSSIEDIAAALADDADASKKSRAGLASSGAAEADTQGTASLATATRPTLLQNLRSVEEVGEPSVPFYEIADDWSNVINVDDTYMADAQLELLRSLGFMSTGPHGGSAEFFELYESNRYNLFPNFVTVDSMMHTYHLYFGHLQRGVERGHLSGMLATLSATLLAETSSQLDVLRGTAWEAAAVRACAFFGVGASLLGVASSIPAEAQATVDAELQLIGAAAGVATSPLTGTDADYSQYTVRGYYEGDSELEAYFRAMMWYGGVAFVRREEDLDRSALLVTLALSQGDAAAQWQAVYEVTAFFSGASDDLSYFEYLEIAQEAYGDLPTVADLPGDEEGWARFRELTEQTPAPSINSLPAVDSGQEDDHLDEGKGFRFMGQRFSIDAEILQNLMYSIVGENEAGDKRMLPDVLDVPAALGSDTALGLLEAQGATGYEGYSEKMAELRAGIDAAGDELWTASLAGQWLATLRPLTETVGEGYPPFMQSDAWARKDLLAFAGSYTELKHDTVLYAKQAMAEMGGGPLEERDDRGYVEPRPTVFGRLAALVAATSEGLAGLGLLDDADAENLSILEQLATQLETIARKELRDELPTDEEFELIRTFGGQLEHFWQEVYQDEADDDLFTTRDFPAAVVTDIATDPNGRVLEIGTGQVATLYAVVPVEGVLRVASGSIYSFYQFEQPIDQRLTDVSWRQMLGIAALDDGTYSNDLPDPVAWTDDFTLSRYAL